MTSQRVYMIKLEHIRDIQEYYDLPLQEIHKAIKIKKSISLQRLLFSIENMYNNSQHIHGFHIDLTHFLRSFEKEEFLSKKEKDFSFRKGIKSAFIPVYSIKNGFPEEQPENHLLLNIIPSISPDNFQYLSLFHQLTHKNNRFDIYNHIIEHENIPYFKECVIDKWIAGDNFENKKYYETYHVLEIEVLKHLCSDYDIDNVDIPSCDDNIIMLKHIYSIYKVQAFLLTLEDIFLKNSIKHINIEIKRISDIIFLSVAVYKEDNSLCKEMNNQLNIFNNFGFYHLFSEYESIPFLKKNNAVQSNQTKSYTYHIHKKNRYDIYQKFIHACQYLSNEERENFVNHLKISSEKYKIHKNIKPFIKQSGNNKRL